MGSTNVPRKGYSRAARLSRCTTRPSERGGGFFRSGGNGEIPLTARKAMANIIRRKRRNTIAEIKAHYQKDSEWKILSVNPIKSVAGLADLLVRQGAVTGYRNGMTIVPILKSLLRRKIISLPPKPIEKNK